MIGFVHVLGALTAPEIRVLQVAFIVLIVAPIALATLQLRNLHRDRAREADRSRRYNTYLMLETAVRTIRSKLPISHTLILSGEVISPSKAQRLYRATPADGQRWTDKVMITDLLELLDRLARGVRMGVIDVTVWQAVSGYNVTMLCKVLRHFVRVSQEHRSHRYSALVEVDEVFTRMINEESLALLEENGGHQLHHRAGTVR